MALKLFVILASLALVYGVSIPSELKLTDQLFQGNIRIGQSLTGSQLNLVWILDFIFSILNLFFIEKCSLRSEHC